MNEDSHGIFVTFAGQEVFVCVVGRGTYQNSQPLRQYGNEMLGQNCREFHVDLHRCQGMDSTFLGVLAGFGLSLRRAGENGRLHIRNASERNLQSLRSLGLDRLMQVDSPETARPVPPETAFRKLPGSDLNLTAKSLDRHATAKLMLDAHEELCRADAQNEGRFKDVKQCLQDKLSGDDHPGENRN